MKYMFSLFPERSYQIAVYREPIYWRERKGRYRLIGSRCKKCGELWWPRRTSEVCPNCHSRDLEEYEFSHEGEVIAFTLDRISQPLMGTEVYGRERRIVAAVKLKEGVVITPTEIVDCSPEEVKEGMKVRLVVRKLRRANNGNWLYGYMWTPILKSESGEAKVKK
jgi:uncharacterized OB-fold protein